MKVVEGLESIRIRLVENEADPATIAAVDMFLKRAKMAPDSTVGSQLQLVRMLMRSPAADQNVKVYNDLAWLEEGMESAAVASAAKRAADDAKPVPKTKKFYKDQKAKEKQ